MATPEDRERESRETDVTKFEELRQEEELEREGAAERVQEEQQPDQDEP
jgi:hypothetical protein